MKTPISSPESLEVNISENDFDGPKKLKAALGLGKSNDENQSFDTQNRKFFDRRAKDVRFLITVVVSSNIIFQINSSLNANS